MWPGTGDNPATFLSLTREFSPGYVLANVDPVRPSEGLVSLGTSDVVLVSTSIYNPHPEYHAFFHPAQIAPPCTQDTGMRDGHEKLRYFNMLVYKSRLVGISLIRLNKDQMARSLGNMSETPISIDLGKNSMLR